MLHRTGLIILALVSLFSASLSPLLSTHTPLRLSAAAQAQGTTAPTLTFTPRPLDPNTSPDSGLITLRELRVPAVLSADVSVAVAALWSGDAAALDANWEVVYQLRGADSAVAAELPSEVGLAGALESGEIPVAEELWLSPELPAGSYTLSVLVRDLAGERAPLALNIANGQADGSYLLGAVAVAAPVVEALPDAENVSAAPELAATGRFNIYLPMTIRAANSVLPSSQVGSVRGYLTTPQELRAIKQKADQGLQPYAANVREMLNHPSTTSATTWVSQSTLSGNVLCSDGSQRDASGNLMSKGPTYLIEGSRLVYAKMLTAHLRGGTSGEAFARNARARILDLLDTTNWGGSVHSNDNQCILYLGWYIPGFVMAADLLEGYPQIWTAADKYNFQRWLATQVFSRVAWASRARVNNWGAGGSYASAVIADYLHDSGLTLREVAPVQRTLTPGQAYAEHTNEQLSRMSTVIAPRDQTSSLCLPRKGIQPGGGIPDELRRATISNPLSLCGATYLPSVTGSYATAVNYHMLHVELLVGHAELALRRGDRRLYDNIASDRSGSILRAIKFVIANPTNAAMSYDWDPNRKAMLYITYRYYRDPAILARLNNSALRSGHSVSYGRLTHSFASGENPALPPRVAPPAP